MSSRVDPPPTHLRDQKTPAPTMPTKAESQVVPEDEKDLSTWEEIKKYKWLLLGIPGTWIVLGLAPCLIYETRAERGTFGDMFGAVNSLFSGFAFAGVIYAIFLQRKELQLQRRELRLTRGEMEKSSTAQSSSANALNLQFELSKLSSQLGASATILASREQSVNSIRGLIATSDGNAKQRLSNELSRGEHEVRKYQQDVNLLLADIRRLTIELQTITPPTAAMLPSSDTDSLATASA